MTQLPSNPYPVGLWCNAYKVCLDFECRSTLQTAPASTLSPLILSRFLGYMILEAPADCGRTYFSNKVIACTNNMALQDLAKFYMNDFVRCFRSAKGRTPATSYDPLKQSFDEEQETLEYLLYEAPQNHQTAKKKALIRDGHRCILTGLYDMFSDHRLPEIRAILDNNPQLSVTGTRAAHILPESTNKGISGENAGSAKPESAASVWTIMDRYGDVAPDELNGSHIHRLENIITMDIAMHDLFDTLLLRIPQFITLTSPDVTNLPVPSPRYLRLHASCCCIIHLSGAGEYIDKIFRDMNEGLVLAADGSSADALAFALEEAIISVH
ncbi:hypothetical protein JB92DRAFT_2763245 [Gautieria morchelliformis]|nr:hypothetical protein JB92DRAFT_2763245 [Gautieria morchelliformis]